jgi:hypothetical protein
MNVASATPPSRLTQLFAPAPNVANVRHDGLMSDRFKLPRWEVIAAVAALLLVTVGLWAGKVITTSAALTAYATTMLAFGTIALAGGTIGLLREQRNANKVLADQEHKRLAQAAEDDIARVVVNRISGPGQYLRVEVANHSSRAIRQVYVWADIERVIGRYHAVVLEADPRTGQLLISRRMRVSRVTVDGKELYHSYRTIFPGQSILFDQDTKMAQCRDPLLEIDNAAIKTWALFADAAGISWWKCSEDGEIYRLDEPPALVQEVPRQLGPGITPDRQEQGRALDTT